MEPSSRLAVVFFSVSGFFLAGLFRLIFPPVSLILDLKEIVVDLHLVPTGPHCDPPSFLHLHWPSIFVFFFFVSSFISPFVARLSLFPGFKYFSILY